MKTIKILILGVLSVFLVSCAETINSADTSTLEIIAIEKTDTDYLLRYTVRNHYDGIRGRSFCDKTILSNQHFNIGDKLDIVKK